MHHDEVHDQWIVSETVLAANGLHMQQQHAVSDFAVQYAAGARACKFDS
jgi:hypothetical protein